MKKIIFFLIVLCANLNSFAQFTLEHTYDNTGWCSGSMVDVSLMYGKRQFYLVHLETDGDKYVKIDKMTQTINFYDLNHVLWKSINYSNVSIISPYPNNDKSQSSILYISQSLFNTDNKVEFMYTYSWYDGTNSTWHATTEIVNEDGAILFSRNAAPLVQPTFPMQYYSIYNTTNGTKMILSNENGTAEIFSLAGTFTAGIATNNILGNAAQMILFPNPSLGGNMITVNYQLPQETKTADLLIYDAQGKQVKTIKIGNAMNSIVLETSEFSKGMYFYTIQKENGEIIANQKSIVVE